MIICPPCLHFPVVFPWTSWLPVLHSQDYPNLVPRGHSGDSHSKTKTRSLAIWKTLEFSIVSEHSTPRLDATRIRLAPLGQGLSSRAACRWNETVRQQCDRGKKKNKQTNKILLLINKNVYKGKDEDLLATHRINNDRHRNTNKYNCKTKHSSASDV